ncbi:MAG: hypothetical protein GTO32_11715, partial [Gammaproteobacteria bacterium]|nr:hypothetical protein [Gammaproteobacteria bacterium]
QDQAELEVSVTVHGASFDYRVPVDLTVAPDTLTVSGSMTVSHADFGLAAFSSVGGLLRVAEDIAVVFEIVAARGT